MLRLRNALQMGCVLLASSVTALEKTVLDERQVHLSH